MLTLLHASDLHFGRLHDPEAASALLTLAHATAPDLIVVSGDLTQRAKVREYREAARYIADLPSVPVVVTVGNHDVPLYRFWERLFAPFRNYRRWISRDLDTVTAVEGATVVALNSAAPRRAIVNGRLDEARLNWAEGIFAAAAPADLRVAVVHHALVGAPDGHRDRPLPRAPHILRRLGEMGVDLVLSGHFHRAFVTTAGEVLDGAGAAASMALVHSGTTTSLRGRVGESGRNTCNVIRSDAASITVVRHTRARGDVAFLPMEPVRVPRRPDSGGGIANGLLTSAEGGS